MNMAKIGLLDVDGHHFPNLPLMKIAAYHKKKGDHVEWLNHLDKYDIVYQSKVFTFSPDSDISVQAPVVCKGGTGYNIGSRLPDDIERTQPDYSIYPMFKFSIQFFSRGCIRQCPFCIVREKEGMIRPVEPMELNPASERIEILDNNFFANPEWRSAVEWIERSGQRINLHGVDVRIMDEEQAYWLNRLKISGSIHIAWDFPQDPILPKVKEMLKYIKPYKIICYVLIGFNSTIEQDYGRVIQLKELGIRPFVQPYRDFHNQRIPTQYERDFAQWVNKREIFSSCDFKDFSPRKGFKCKHYLTPHLSDIE